jgi:putative tricarboxylic transport membrane protein
MKVVSDRISGIFCLLFSGYVCMKSLKLGLGGWRKPGSGFLSFWSGVALGILAVLMVIQSIRQNKSSAVEDVTEKTNLRPIILVLISLVGYIFLLEPLGFVITTVIFVGFLLKTVEKKGWILTLWVSLVVALGCYVIFEVLLGSELPKGIQELVGL